MGLTQTQMSVKADVSASILSQFESGRRKVLSPRLAYKLATAYGITIDELRDGKSNQPAHAA